MSRFSDNISYKIINHIFDERKDFIVLGLCGKYGSGVSTAADILCNEFVDLNIPDSINKFIEKSNDIDEHEYRILYNFASQNWIRFHKISSSSLITRRIIIEKNEVIIEFLKGLLPEKNLVQDTEIQAIIEAFKKETEEKFSINEFESDKENIEKELRDNGIKFGKKDDDSITIINEEMSKLFNVYEEKRKNKEGFNCKFLYYILKKYIYDFLPKASKKFWNNIKRKSAYTDISTHALQIIGNNLRMFGKAFSEKDDTFNEAGYSKIASDINIAIKIFRANQINNLSADDKQKVRTAIVVDSIKNPYESMYLKERYSNYYLIGIYTEETNRNNRIIKSKDIADVARKDIDVVENNSELKKKIIACLESNRVYLDTQIKKIINVIEENSDLKSKIKECLKFDKEDWSAEIKDVLDKNSNLKSKIKKYLNIDPDDMPAKIESIKNVVDKDSDLKLKIQNCLNSGQKDFSEQIKEIINLIKDNSNLESEIEKYLLYNNLIKKYSGPQIIIKIIEIYGDKKLNEILYSYSFVFQNVMKCLDMADILINNEEEYIKGTYNTLKWHLIRYICLIINPGLILPTPIERCMQIADAIKLNSGCISRQVGAVITDSEYHILSVGWNQQPEGQLPCLYTDICELYNGEYKTLYSDYETESAEFRDKLEKQVTDIFNNKESALNINGKMPCFCFKDYYNSLKRDKNQVHTRALHAEETAFLNLGTNDLRAKGGVLFTTSSPCELCSKKAVYKGISQIYYIEPYSGISFKHVLSIGNLRPKFTLFTGAIGTAYSKLYTPLLSRKDENEMWLNAKMNCELGIKSNNTTGSSSSTNDKEI